MVVRYLTDRKINEISNLIAKESELRNLATKLNIQTYKVVQALGFKHRNIVDASHDVISEWSKGYKSRKDAFDEMHNALC